MAKTKTESWRELRLVSEKANCLGLSPVLLSDCEGCPIVQQCFDYARADRFATGVWGGRVWREDLDKDDF